MGNPSWWEIIQENYSKLDYIHKNNIKQGLTDFIETMDYYTNAFINELDLDNYEDGFADECKSVSILLKESLTEISKPKKIKLLLKAYQFMIDIGEQVRHEKHKIVLCQEFSGLHC